MLRKSGRLMGGLLLYLSLLRARRARLTDLKPVASRAFIFIHPRNNSQKKRRKALIAPGLRKGRNACDASGHLTDAKTYL